jgi:starch synthase
MEKPLRVLWAASECSPFARVGELGDLVASIPAGLRARGVDARVVLPRYGWISPVTVDNMSRHLAPLAVPLGDGEAWCAVYDTTVPGTSVPVYMLDHEVLFDRPYLYDPPGGTAHDNLARFTFLSRGALQLTRHLGWAPDVIHAHDWPTALVPIYLDTIERRTMLSRTAGVITVHDVTQQGRFSMEEFKVTQLGPEVLHERSVEEYGAINLLKGALRHAHAVTTTTRAAAERFLTPEGGAGLDPLFRERTVDVLWERPTDDREHVVERLIDVYQRAIDLRRRAS